MRLYADTRRALRDKDVQLLPERNVLYTTGTIWLPRTHRYCKVNISYPEGVTGTIPVMPFCHGLGGSRDDYPTVAKLARFGLGVLRPDFLDSPYVEGRGAADNKWPERYRDTQDICAGVDALLAPLGLYAGPMVVGGHSFGARCAMAALGMQLRSGEDFSVSRAVGGLFLSPAGPDSTTSTTAPWAKMTKLCYSITGTKDSPRGENPADNRKDCARQMPGPALLNSYKDGDHGHGVPFGEHGVHRQDQEDAEHDGYLALLDYLCLPSSLNVQRDIAAQWLTEGGTCMWEKMQPALYEECFVRNWPKAPMNVALPMQGEVDLGGGIKPAPGHSQR